MFWQTEGVLADGLIRWYGTTYFAPYREEYSTCDENIRVLNVEEDDESAHQQAVCGRSVQWPARETTAGDGGSTPRHTRALG